MDQITKKIKNNQQQSILQKRDQSQQQEIKQDKIQIQSILGREFYSQDVVSLARALIGKIIVREHALGLIKVMIVETEAYKAPEDKACHAYNNKKTERTKYFWQDGGHFYVYNIYGPQNNCINITASDKDHPEAVLIRAVEPIEGLDIIKQNRKTICKKIFDLTNGPGKVGMALGIDKSYNQFDLTKGDECYLIENDLIKEKSDGNDSAGDFEIEISKRINIDYAEEWKEKLWRFTIKNNKFVSNKK